MHIGAGLWVWGTLAIAATLLVLPGSPLSPHSAPLGTGLVWGQALVAAAVATGAEALSPSGADNLTVPLPTALVLVLLNV